MSAVNKFIENNIIEPTKEFLKDARKYVVDVIESAVEEIFRWFGIEEEEVVQGYVAHKQLFDVDRRHKDRVLRHIQEIMKNKCNTPRDIARELRQRNAEANAKMQKPYSLAAMQEWKGFTLRSNLSAAIVVIDELIPVIEAEVGRTVSSVVTTEKRYPSDIEQYLHLIDTDPNETYMGGGKVITPMGGNKWATIINVIYDSGNHTLVPTAVFKYSNTVKTTTTVTTTLDVPLGETTIGTTILIEEQQAYEGVPPSAWVELSNTYSKIIKPTEAGDVAGVVVTTNDVVTNETDSAVVPIYSAMSTEDYLVTNYLSTSVYEGRSFWNITLFDALSDDVAGRGNIGDLEMMPLIRLRDDAKNVNGISDAVYTAYARASDPANSNPDKCKEVNGFLPCAIPRSERPSKPLPTDYPNGENDANYKKDLEFYLRYTSTQAVLRPLAFSIDRAVHMVCGGYTGYDNTNKIENVTGGYIRFAINPQAKRVKQGVNKKVPKDPSNIDPDTEAVPSEMEPIPAVVHATFDFFSIMAESGAFDRIYEYKIIDTIINESYSYGYITFVFSTNVYAGLYLQWQVWDMKGTFKLTSKQVNRGVFVIGAANTPFGDINPNIFIVDGMFVEGFITTTSDRADTSDKDAKGNSIYGFQSALIGEDGTTQKVGTFNSAISVTGLSEKFNQVTAKKGLQSLSIESGGEVLRLKRQITAYTQKEIVVYGLKGTTSIKRHAINNELGEDLIALVQSGLRGGDESALLLPVSLDFARGLPAIDRLELFYSSVHLETYSSVTTVLEYYETAAFFEFLQGTLIVVGFILTVVSFGTLSIGYALLGAALGAAIAAGGEVYAENLRAEIKRKNEELSQKLKDATTKLRNAKKGKATTEMESMVFGLTEMVGLLLQDIDTNLTMDYEQVIEIGLGKAQYNNDILYREKYEVYCKSKSQIEFKSTK